MQKKRPELPTLPLPLKPLQALELESRLQLKPPLELLQEQELEPLQMQADRLLEVQEPDLPDEHRPSVVQ